MAQKIKCTHCKDIIESKYTHDFKRCGCGKIAIDGGDDYTRIIFSEPEDYITIKDNEN
jgi:hypothetical protein